MNVGGVRNGDAAAVAAGTTGAADGSVEGDLGGGGAANKAAGATTTTTHGLDVEGSGVIARREDGAVLDIDRHSTAIAAVSTAGTDANVDADVTTLNVVDVAASATAATADGLSHQSDGVVTGGGDDEVIGVQPDGAAVATATASA